MELEHAALSLRPLRHIRPKHLWVWAAALVLGCSAAGAAPLTLTIANPDRIGMAGASEIFAGTITNNTGGSLKASDLFLNFAGYDAANVTLTQLLGAPDFAIADGDTSSFADLFSFYLEAAAPIPATFFADVVVEDPNNNVSDTLTVSVRTVPEPGTYGLAGLALFAVYLARWRSTASRKSVRPDAAGPSANSSATCAAWNGGASC